MTTDTAFTPEETYFQWCSGELVRQLQKRFDLYLKRANAFLDAPDELMSHPQSKQFLVTQGDTLVEEGRSIIRAIENTNAAVAGTKFEPVIKESFAETAEGLRSLEKTITSLLVSIDKG